MPSLAARLTAQWTRRGPLACALWPLHLLMTGLVKLRRFGFRQGWWPSRTLPVPVVVVGNRVVGGAGKTPTTMALVQHLRRRGWQPGVLSRGYGRRVQGAAPLILDARSEDELDASRVGDECWLIWRHTAAPIGIAARRADAGEALLQAHPEINILVCDDGLQHLALARQVEVVVFDERGAGNGWLMPAGLLREPVDTPPGPGGAQAPLVVYNASRPSTRLPGHLARKSLAPLQRFDDWWSGKPLPARRPGALLKVPQALLDAGKERVWAVAGIAQPERFFKPLRQTGLRFKRCPLADHDPLDVLPWPETVAHVVLTEKDAVKLSPDKLRQLSPATQVWVAALDFHLDKDFWQALDLRLLALATQPSPPTSPAALG